MKGLLGLLLVTAVVIVLGFRSEPHFGAILLSCGIPWFFVLNMIPPMIFLERKGSAYIQDRVGPERAFIPGLGLRLAGMVHNLADVVKLATKEEIIPRHVHRGLYVAAPVLSMVVALVVGAVIPYAHPIEWADGTRFRIQALDLNVGLLWILACGSVGVYAVALAGWASNNKFGQLGGLRASASMISYEITFGLAVANACLVYQSINLNEMVMAQHGTFLGVLPRWGVFLMPVGFLLFLIAAFAETNRAPFDLAEAESELVAGFHTEYGAFKFALFFMAEYVAIVVQCLAMATLFFGGWQPLPWNLLHHEWLRQPENAALVARAILWAVAAGGAVVGLALLRWHARNRVRWTDARRREGAWLAVLFGFGPAAAALLVLLLWGGVFGPDGAALTCALVQFLSLAG
jgi:NADH-quinone oxidoreductase subunit H